MNDDVQKQTTEGITFRIPSSSTNQLREESKKKQVSRREIGFSIDDLWEPKKKKYFPGRRRIMNHSTNCKHRPIYEIENKLYPDYDDGLFQRMYIELKEEKRSTFNSVL